MKKSRLAIVGATGAVGLEFLNCLEKRQFPVESLKLFASARSRGKKLSFHGKTYEVEELSETCFQNTDIAFFSAGSGISEKWAPQAVAAGALVIDNSSAFRMDAKVPLVIPEVNPQALSKDSRLIANPNCSTIIAITPLAALHRKNSLKRIWASTYQAVSGAGAEAVQELLESTKNFLEGKSFTPKVFPFPSAFNLFSHNSPIDKNTGYNKEELKMVEESKKILNLPDLRVSITCVRVPVIRAHSIALTVEFENPVDLNEVRKTFNESPGIRLTEDFEKNLFPMPVESSGRDDIFVGRIRRDLSDPSGCTISLFVCGDQLLKGAALNGIQIAELILNSQSKSH